jgi:hypothetical protein
VTGYGYHGHDTVLTVQPEPADPAAGPQLPPLIVRTQGRGSLPPGSPVTLRAHGPVLAWPAPNQPRAQPRQHRDSRGRSHGRWMAVQSRFPEGAAVPVRITPDRVRK